MITATKVQQIKELTFQEMEEIEGLKDMIRTMIANRVKIVFEVKDEDAREAKNDVISGLRDFCNTKFKHHWAFTFSQGDIWDFVTNTPHSKYDMAVTVWFESAEDIPVFKSEYAVLSKLGQV